MPAAAEPVRPWAIILAGGRGSRLGGIDKAALEVGGRSLLERVLNATRAAEHTVVVADETVTSRPVTWAREQPPWSGPVAALYAGIEALIAEYGHPPGYVVVMAVDMPHVTPFTVQRLLVSASSRQHDAVLVRSRDGHSQPLCGIYRTAALVRERPTQVADRSMRALLARLDVGYVSARGSECEDVDTWGDLTTAELHDT